MINPINFFNDDFWDTENYEEDDDEYNYDLNYTKYNYDDFWDTENEW